MKLCTLVRNTFLFFNFFVNFSQDNLCASIQSKNFMRNGRTCSPDALTCFACERGRSSCYERTHASAHANELVCVHSKHAIVPKGFAVISSTTGKNIKWTFLILQCCEILVENVLSWAQTISFSYRIHILGLRKCVTNLMSGFPAEISSLL